MTLKLNGEDAKSWDLYAAAALTASVPNSTSPQQAAVVAAELADILLAERQARRKAYSDFIGS